jgi:hypothetical protein
MRFGVPNALGNARGRRGLPFGSLGVEKQTLFGIANSIRLQPLGGMRLISCKGDFQARPG